MREEASAKPNRRETGLTLLITVMILLLITLMGMAGLDAVRGDQQVAGFQNRHDIALHAADAGLAKGFETLTTTRTPAIPVSSLGDGTIFPHGQPSFRADPTLADPIQKIGTGAFPGVSINIGQGGTPTYMLQYWRIRAQGSGPGGSVARVEAVAGALIAN